MNTYRQILRDSKKGALFGLGIGLVFWIVLSNFTFDLGELLGALIFGAALGFCLTFSLEHLTKVVFTLVPGLSQYLLFHLCLHFLMGFGLFYVVSSITPLWFNPGDIFRFSLAVGVITMLVGLFFIYSLEVQERLRLQRENQEFAVLEERNRIAGELHNSLEQNLHEIKSHLEKFDHLREHDPAKLDLSLAETQTLVGEIQSQLKQMITELKPTVFVGDHAKDAYPDEEL